MNFLIQLFVSNKLLGRLSSVHSMPNGRVELPIVIPCRHKRLLCLDLKGIFSQSWSEIQLDTIFFLNLSVVEEFNTTLTCFLPFRILSDVPISAKPLQRPQSELVANSQPSAPSYTSVGAHASQLGSFSYGPVSLSLNYELLKPSWWSRKGVQGLGAQVPEGTVLSWSCVPRRPWKVLPRSVLALCSGAVGRVVWDNGFETVLLLSWLRVGIRRRFANFSLPWGQGSWLINPCISSTSGKVMHSGCSINSSELNLIDFLLREIGCIYFRHGNNSNGRNNCLVFPYSLMVNAFLKHMKCILKK